MPMQPADSLAELHFQGPFAFLPGLEVPSIFSTDAEASANGPGVYVWVARSGERLCANYVGQTGVSMRGRQIGHLADMFTGKAKIRDWRRPKERAFHYDPSSNTQVAFLFSLRERTAQVLDCLERLRILCCPLPPDDSMLKRVESGLIRALRANRSASVEAAALDNDRLSVNWVDFQVRPLSFPSGVAVGGLTESISI